jgi:alpha-mannosidase
MLADHAWNGANDANRALNTALRREWVASTARCFDRVIEDGLANLGKHISSEGQSRRFAVVNALPWFRDGVIILDNEEADLEVINVTSNEKLKTQSFVEDGRRKMAVKVDSIPSIGYRVLELQTGKTEPDSVSSWMPAPNQLEGPFYFVEVDPVSGGISRLYDKVRGKDLVDNASPYQINQCAHFSDGMVEPGKAYQLLHPPKVSGGKEFTASAVTVTPGPAGAVFASLFVQTGIGSIHIKTTITLYAELDRVDILNEVEKPPTSERQELDFYFPFNVPERTYRYETPGAVIEAGKDQLPGAGLSHAVTRHFVDVSNEEYGVTLSQADSFVIEFGHRTTTEDTLEIDPSNSTILVHALGNIFDSYEAIRDQGGDSHFVFRFSLKGHAGGFDPVAAVHFAWEDNNELLTTPVQGKMVEDLPADSYSFISTSPSNAILTTLKPAEENGLIARLWECAGSSGPMKLLVTSEFDLKAAVITDHLEHDQTELLIEESSVPIAAKPCGITTLRMVGKPF